MFDFDLPNDEGAAKLIVHGIGSKGILSVLPFAFVNPGDVVLMTTPGYPVFGTHTKYLGGKVVNLPLKEENGFLPDLDALDHEDPRDPTWGIPRIEGGNGKSKSFSCKLP
jgi:aspartate/methionine/tyrosine aminotransferase